MNASRSKKCFKCDKEKPLTNFYKHKQMGDGHLNKCKECAKRDASKHRSENLEKIREYDRDRAKLPHRIALRVQMVKQWRAKHPERYRAHTALNNAVRDARILKPANCAVCGEFHKQIEGHHFDYRKPLEVVWCCPICHWKLDEERREFET